jgi:DUF4097 and DUF4098 domain-containing protein YvlB
VQYAATQTATGVDITSTVSGTSIGDVAAFRVNRGADVSITVPSKTSISIETLGGVIDVRNLEATVTGHTGGGAITIVDASGEITLDTSRGDVTVERFNGALSVESDDGNVDVLESSGSIMARTGYGRVTFRGELNATGAENRLESADGRMFITLTNARDLRIDARASTVRLKAPTAFSATTQTDSRVEGTLGSGSVPVTLRASNGALDLEILN